MTKNEKPKKNLIKLFSNSSYRFISDFLNDSAEKRAQEQANENIFLKLKMASLQNSLVVIQVQDENNEEKFQTISGWLPKAVTNDSIVIRTQDNQLVMLTIDQKGDDLITKWGSRKYFPIKVFYTFTSKQTSVILWMY